MHNQSCLFCKIIRGDIKTEIVKENELVIAIRDIAPKAPTHILLIPKKHIISIADISDSDEQYAWHMLMMARDLNRELCAGKGFNLIVNNGADAGQSVFHLHFHLLSGKNIYHGGFSL